MLGSSGLVGTSSGGGGGGGGEAHAESGSEPAVGPTAASSSMGSEVDVSGGGGGDMFEGDRSGSGGGGGGGNRWPRQETLALLKIRSDMDVVFRDSSLKGPLWEQVSRKMEELGYHRSSKKCKEKFENVYKYHKRTKDGRLGKSEGKTYRFFDQLEAFEHHQGSSSGPLVMTSLPPLPPPPRHHEEAVPVTMVMPPGTSVTVPSTGPHPITVLHASSIPGHQGYQIPHQQTMPGQSSQVQVEGSMPSSPSATQSSSSSTSSDEEVMGGRKRKRKWKDLFQKMMKEVIDKQEELQRRFLETVEKREQDRAARDEAWKRQEIARLNREHEVLVQERSIAAAKDAALISFLHKLSEQHQINIPLPVQIQTQAQTQVTQGTKVNTSQPREQTQTYATQLPASIPQAQRQPPQPLIQLQVPQPPLPQVVANVDTNMSNNGDDQTPLTPVAGASSSRWPKAEVEALINLRTNLEQKYQDNGPKGPLWEEISSGMKRIGYNRNAKRCKEKWENINKYFKKVKESNKKRPDDSKTCPYFHQLDALYREKGKLESTPTSSASYQPTTTAEMGSVGPIQTQPEQQWPALQGDPRSESDEEDDDDDDDDDDDHGSGQFEIVPNNAATTTTATSTAE